jgi:ADP-heptose:LPS heptosyltransferase
LLSVGDEKKDLFHKEVDTTIEVMKKPKKIIVIDFGGIGDLVLAIPFLRGLKRNFPSSDVSVLCAERTGMILKEQPYIDGLFLSFINFRSLLTTGMRLRKKRFDMAINLMPETSYFSAIKMYLLFNLLNAREWIGRDTEGRGFFYDVKVSEDKMQIENEVLIYGRILKAIADGDFDPRLEFYFTKDIGKRAEALLLKERNFPNFPFVLINPGSDWPSRRWPIGRFAELVEKLVQLFSSVEFGIIGTSSEAELAHFIKERCGERIFILTGKTPVEILPAVMKQSVMVLTNDSGPAHVARAVGVPVVILAGPSAPGYLKIQGGAESTMIQHLVFCSPCLRVSCDRMDCWKELLVDEVLQVASKMLRKVIKHVN